MNERKGRVDFNFKLSPNQTVSFDVFTGTRDIAVPAFPTNGTFAGNPARGELVCFAVDTAIRNQIAFNHLTGTATVVINDSDATQKKQAFRYNPWSFIARSSGGTPAPDNTIQGTPGNLVLSGGGPGTYDACPAYNIANFMPNNATLARVHTFDSDLSVVSCNQDLRQDFKLYLTKLLFTVWNAKEVAFTGSYQCVNSVVTAPLSVDDNGALVNPSNFEFSRLGTTNARFTVQAVGSTQCPGSTGAGLLGVLTSSVGIINGTNSGEDAELGSTTQGAGVAPGFVLWDPGHAVVPKKH